MNVPDQQPSNRASQSNERRARPESLWDCAICPRSCHANRVSGKPGYCRAGEMFPIASICAHMGEEPVISGRHGICNIFFAHCNMQCIFCQNSQISSNQLPISIYDMSLTEIVAQVEAILDSGATGVGFVSPSHCLPQMKLIIRALKLRGRDPVYFYNTNGYDRLETIESLEGVIHVYLPDLKYMDSRLAREYSDTPDYVDTACRAIREMYRQKGADISLDENGLITCGLIIRHLVLPGHVENSKAVLRFIARELSPDVHISLMAQYHPTKAVAGHPLLGRRLTKAEYDEVTDEFENLGFHRGWVQDISSSADYLPNFLKRHPFED